MHRGVRRGLGRGQLPSLYPVFARIERETEIEGEEEKEFISNEEIQAALLEDKSSLIQETELYIKEECLSRLEPRNQHRQHGRFLKLCWI